MNVLALCLLFSCTSASAAEISRVATDFDRDGKPDIVSISYVPGNENALAVTVELSHGTSVRNQVLLRRAGQNGEAGASLKVLSNGRVQLSSVKDWSSSNNSLDVVLSYRGGLIISAVDYAWDFRGAFGGCNYDFARGTLLVNGKSRRYSARVLKFTETSSVDKYAAECVKL